MGGWFRIVAAFLSFAGVLTACGLTVPEIGRMSREEAAQRMECVVTGAVTGAFSWLDNSCILADAADPNGVAIYVGGNLPNVPRARLIGEGTLAIGDVVEISGHICQLMLEPGIAATEIRRIGWTDFPNPPVLRLADLQSGRFNNRRVRIRGVVRQVCIEGNDALPVTLMTIGTLDGCVMARLRGLHIEFSSLRDADVQVDGIVMPNYNQRAEFLRPEIEVFGPDAVQVIGDAVRPIPEVGGEGGVLMWSPDGFDGHLRRMDGVVTYVSQSEHFFVLQGGYPVRIFKDDDIYPDVGDHVEVTGFPTLVDDCGAMASAEFRLLGRPSRSLAPMDAPLDEIDYLLDQGDPGDVDYNLRFLRLKGRVVSVGRSARGRTTISLLVGARGHRLPALIDGELPSELTRQFVDSPIVRLTGIMEVNLIRAPNTKRGLVVGGMMLRLRRVSDIEVMPDAVYRSNRIGRILKSWALWLWVPLVLAVLLLIIRNYRQKSISAAISKERRRMAGELHDTISQHLSGVRLLLFSVKESAAGLSERTHQALEMAGNVLDAARREVRDAVLNLQSENFIESAPRELLRSIAQGVGRMRNLRVRVQLRGLPSEMSATEKTDLVSIVQEAMTNAVKHGRARNVILVSDPLPDGGFVLSVLNDGEPFDARHALGPESGHFGLSGMQERANRSKFILSIGRRDGYVEVRIERRPRNEEDSRGNC